MGLRSYVPISIGISNHLGNVLSVISDKVIPHPSGGSVAYYKADILQAMDYSPFGVTLKGRNLKKTGLADEFRFGYQGSEADDEMKDEGNSYTTYFRQLDPRLGRWFSTDPVVQPWQSSYCSMDNNAILHNDPKGDRVIIDGSKSDKKSFLKELNKDSKTQFKMTRKGELKIKRGTPIEGNFAFNMDAAISEPQIAVLRLERDKPKIDIDDYKSGVVDIGDLEKTSDNSAYKQNIIHFVVERFTNPKYESTKSTTTRRSFNSHHDEGLNSECIFLRERFPNLEINFKGENYATNTYNDGKGHTFINYVFDFNDVQLVLTYAARVDAHGKVSTTELIEYGVREMVYVEPLKPKKLF